MGTGENLLRHIPAFKLEVSQRRALGGIASPCADQPFPLTKDKNLTAFWVNPLSGKEVRGSVVLCFY